MVSDGNHINVVWSPQDHPPIPPSTIPPALPSWAVQNLLGHPVLVVGPHLVYFSQSLIIRFHFFAKPEIRINPRWDSSSRSH